MLDKLIQILAACWAVLGQMAPYLLFGFLAAGVLSVLISVDWVERHLGGRGWKPVIKAALFGVPLPLCSCSVIPVSASMRRHGAGRGAVTAFLLSTPQTGADNIAVIYALLGPVFAVISPIAAFVTGLVGGGLAQFFDPPKGNGPKNSADTQAKPCQEACCASGKRGHTILRMLEYGFIALPRDIGKALLVGVAIAGLMTAQMPTNLLEPYLGHGIVSILVFMAIGLPIYVCSSASVPIAAGFIHLGASPGAAFAFLISGPATNAATFTTIWRLLGRWTAVLYMAVVAASAIGFGLLINWIDPVAGGSVPGAHAHVHDAGAGWASHVWASALLGVLAYSFWAGRIGRRAVETAEVAAQAANLDEVVLRVSGMTCEHCARNVQKALAESSGVAMAAVDLKRGRAVATGEAMDPKALVDAVARAGYKAEVAS